MEEEESGFVKNRKCRRKRPRKKLLVDEKVEVRSLEDGFLGSWHSGTVVACRKQRRHVRYDHLLADDGTDNLIEVVGVSEIVEGVNCVNTVSSSNYRGCIRPTPPGFEFGKGNLSYGLCVDVFHQDAWWEGVIFDQEDGSEERRVFFPDLGDEMSPQIDLIRITQDWDEVMGTWHRRGTWLFTELIEKLRKELYIPVSVKQLWYDVREKRGFEEIGEWTSSKTPLWEQLVLESINDNLRITVNHFYELNIRRSLLQETEPSTEASKHLSSIDDSLGSDLGESCAVLPAEDPSLSDCIRNTESDSSHPISGDRGLEMTIPVEHIISCHDEETSLRPQPLSVVHSDPNRTSHVSCITSGEELSSVKSCITNQKSRTQRHVRNWQPADSKIVPEAIFCPEAVSDYVLKKGSRNTKAVKVRMHLKHMGWTIEHMTDQSGFHRIRYISPDGQCQHSLRQVCLSLMGEDKVSPQDLPNTNKSILAHQDEPTENHATEESCQLALHSSPSDTIDENDLCLEAVQEYNKIDKNCILKRDPSTQIIKLRAKKHLSANGWVFSKKMLGDRLVQQYTSPEGRSVYSLTAACRKYLCTMELDKGVSTRSPLKNLVPGVKAKMKSVALNKVGKAQGFQTLTRKRKSQSSDIARNFTLKQVSLGSQNRGLNLRHGKLPAALMKLRSHVNASEKESRILRLSKRVQQVITPSSTHKNPLTILSWLIDSNVVLPRARVYYCKIEDRSKMKEGKITRDGIKCSCCRKIYTISSFEAHAARTYHRPAANIFLEDGRSLLDCQVQAIKARKKAETSLKGKWYRGKNDYICSACHYGGELILCDKCPSAFHKSCLGLENIPDGDWFCPSCCCGICGLIKLKEDAENSKDGKLIICEQCECKYHVGCLPNQGSDNKLETNQEKNWFCSKDCKEIFVNLQELIGKPVAVGADNLTWTLMKSLKSDTCELDAEIEALAEYHSKLNIALEMMHECFKPVKEPLTRRDLVEDVIFSRGSELNRLNFKGFYTVLLEKKDELITVATVRIYGKKVAEIPLVGTRFRYRRLGMCRILMNELEKKLMNFGVERLVLPAVSSVLNTWTTSFGFSKMTDSERKNFLCYTFLDFQGTEMCQKLLKKSTLTESVPPLKGHCPQLCSESFRSEDNIRLDTCTAISEVSLGEHPEESRIDEAPSQAGHVEEQVAGRLNKGLMDAGHVSSGGGPPFHLVSMENQHDPRNHEPRLNGNSQGCSFKRVRLEDSSSLRRYKRRKALACG